MGRARFDVAGMSADEFPNEVEHNEREATSTAVDAVAFLDALSRCVTSCSNQPSRPTLSGVHVRAEKDGELYIEASDGNQLAREWVERDAGPALDVIIPAMSVAVIAKLFGASESLTLSMSGLRAIVTGDDDSRCETVLIEGPFPNTAQIIGQKIPHEATVDRIALLAAVKRVGAVSVKETLLIRTEWSADHVVVSGVNDSDSGTSEDVVPCAFTGPSTLRITFGPRYLIHALSLRTADTIRIGLKDGNAMITIRDDGSTVIQNLLMPRRDLGDN